jgi:amino acid adenylation domain-containing protein
VRKLRLEELLAASTSRTPKAIAAMEPGGAQLTYSELSLYADEVYRELTALGVVPGDRVGLCVPKCLGALATIFGILKAGAAYVPVDASAPTARNAYIFGNCATKAIVIDVGRAESLRAELSGGDWELCRSPAFEQRQAGFVVLARGSARAHGSPPETGLAYILYTSGSTGRPKGVMHSHSTALSFIDWCSQEFRPEPHDCFSSHAPFHFDLSILDIYVPIKHGASVVLIGADAGKQPGTLTRIIADQKITVWYSTPSILRMLIEYGKLEEHDTSALRIVCFAGEVFPIKHLRALMAHLPKPAYYNLYGPTETNVCTYFKVPANISEYQETSLPIGKPCSGDITRVVLPDGAEAARGTEGELLVAGGSVMLGYWNLPELNAAAFSTHGGRTWYRTGDVVREDESGDYIFLGRRDRMIKRRGFRVELGEIEAALHRHPAIPEAAVIAKTTDQGEVQVHAFISWSDQSPPSTVELKRFSSRNLPLYMVPDQFSVVAELPKTSTDKIDYQRLKGFA